MRHVGSIVCGFFLLSLIGCGVAHEASPDARHRMETKSEKAKVGGGPDGRAGTDWVGDPDVAVAGEAKSAPGAGAAFAPPPANPSDGKSIPSPTIPAVDTKLITGDESPPSRPTKDIAKKSDPAIAEPVAGTATKPAKQSPKLPPAGVLTAGSFDDNLDPLVFASYLKRFGQNQLAGKLGGPRVQVIVKDVGGRPVAGARVKLSAGNQAGEEITTRTYGQATFVLSWDDLPTDQELTAQVTPPDGSPPISDKIPAGAPRWEITLPTTLAKLPKNLDLTLVIDTTGSMGDELKYVLGEIKGISADIKARFPEVNQRFGLILYRDQGDEYVTRMFDFTPSVDELHKNLSKQAAGGGGDYPEAVHKGLEQAHQLRWRLDADTARLVFLIGDAPPHLQFQSATMKAVNTLRKDGIALYPVACSGYDDACELVWRSSALLTSSQFLFLTDDSGVGASHAEPKIPYYHVELLNKLVVRMVACELTGERVQPLPGEIIRTVGKKIN